MFSSNQIFSVSGALSHTDELETALTLALRLSGNYRSFSEKTSIPVYQITSKNKYALGWAGSETPKGWQTYPFDFDINIICSIIRQFLAKQKVERDIWDGGYDKGFLVKVIDETFSDENEDGVKSPFYGIVTIEPYTCFYSK